MKRVISIIVLLLCLYVYSLCTCACSPLERSVYTCTIDYTINNNPVSEKITIVVPSTYVPACIYSNGIIKIVGSGSGNYQWHCAIVIKTNQEVKLQRFDYILVREYKVSRWDGHELK